MTCKILCHLESRPYSYGSNIGPGYGGGFTVAVSICETHNWRFPESQTLAHDTLCPIGRIEKATEEAIEKIKEL